MFQGNKGSTFDAISTSDLREKKIPLPPKPIQEKIVSECKIVDKEVEKAEQTIDKAKNEIESGFNEVIKNRDYKKIEDVCISQSGGTPSRKVNEYWSKGTINWLRSEVCQNIILNESFVKEKITQLGYEKSSAKLFKNGTYHPNKSGWTKF